MAEREFKDFTGKGQDQDGEDVESTVRAHVVTKDTAGEVSTRVGRENVHAGQVLVETDRPGVYDVLTKAQWESTDYSSSKSAAKSTSADKRTSKSSAARKSTSGRSTRPGAADANTQDANTQPGVR